MPILEMELSGARKNDIVAIQQREHARATDPKDVFKHAEVEIEDGAPVNGKKPRVKVALKFAVDQPYIFAVFSENTAYHNRERDEWDHAARTALEKYVALKGVRVKSGPMREFGNAYNWTVEADRAFEMSEAAVRDEQSYQERKAAAELMEQVEEQGLASVLQSLLKAKR